MTTYVSAPEQGTGTNEQKASGVTAQELQVNLPVDNQFTYYSPGNTNFITVPTVIGTPI